MGDKDRKIALFSDNFSLSFVGVKQLSNFVARFLKTSPSGGIGRRAGFKIQ